MSNLGRRFSPKERDSNPVDEREDAREPRLGMVYFPQLLKLGIVVQLVRAPLDQFCLYD
jgi:hypothetical protein